MSTFRKNLSNIPGWRTDRKIIIFESDDWGSIRTKSKKDYDEMKAKGLNLDLSNFSKYDCFESNDDLEKLFDVLTSFKDINNRPATFTPMCIVANPDFEKIRANNFKEYYYETIKETSKRYNNSERVLQLWNTGKENKFFVPALHGREHINIEAWMKGLNNRNKVLLNSFNHESIGVFSDNNGTLAPQHLGAFYPETTKELESLKGIIEDAGKIFSNLLVNAPTHFIAPNRESPKNLDICFKKIGVEFLTLSKVRKYPTGKGSHNFQLNWLGKVNKHKQIIITRNCIFEPSSNSNIDWVDSCINDINSAFMLNKPAIINSHRVNYIGSIDSKNSDFGLSELKRLLTKITKKWPNIEFMTSTDLGYIISNKKQ